jgi:serine/threonine-protein kinase
VEFEIDEETTHGDGVRRSQLELSPQLVAGRYELRALLGTGGMGSVYRVFDRELEEVVALKMIRRDLLGKAEMVERFRREVRLSRRVTHRNVARVFDIGGAAGERFFTMEFVAGRSLGSALEQARLPVGEVLRIGRDLALGLAAAHAVGVVHRDLKPDNVIVAQDGRAVITDFGIARSLELPPSEDSLSGSWLGTPVYLSPEVVVGGVADERSDLFALGVMLFEALTGRLPWDGTDFETVAARLELPAMDPRDFNAVVPVECARALLECMARMPEDRPGSAERIAAVFATCADSFKDPSLRATLPMIASPTSSGFAVERPPPSIAKAVSGFRTVAVLPFEDAGNEQAGYLSEGVTEALILALGRAPSLAVRPRGRVLPFRKTGLLPLELGHRLDAEALVFGAVVSDTALARVGLRVIDSNEGFLLWSGHFERPIDQLFPLIHELAAAVTNVLSSGRPAPCVESNAAGLTELLLQARYAYHSFWERDSTRAVAFFEQALQLAPEDPRVIAGHALACLRLSFFTGDALDQVRAAVAHADKVAPNLPETLLARASLLVQESKPVAAVLELLRALEQAPDLAEANWLLGRLLLESDAVELAARRLEWALAIEPALTVARRDLARAHALLGQWQEVEQVAASEPDATQVGPWLDRARYAMWKRDPALARLHLSALPSPTGATDGPLEIARALLAMVAEARSPFHEPALHDFVLKARGTPRRGAFAAQIEAELHAFGGAREDALRAIKAALHAGLTDLSWLERCPLFNDLREDEAFQRARLEVGLVAAPVREAIVGA